MKNMLQKCNLCPRQCGANRLAGQKGICGAAGEVVVAKAFAHKWEEPCISGEKGSGTVFFTHCNMKCIFCQNFRISQEGWGKTVTVERLAGIFLKLQQKGVHNINLVTPTIYTLQIIEAIKLARSQGLSLPVVWNSSAYESADAIRALSGLVDVYLPDLKYFDERTAVKYSAAPNYFDTATRAILEMFAQVGEPAFDEGGIIKKGLIIRHLILPGHKEDSKKILRWISQNLPGGVYVSLMSQYIPYYKAEDHPELNRKLSAAEYEEVLEYFFDLGLENGFMQEPGAASEEYVPGFDLGGI